MKNKILHIKFFLFISEEGILAVYYERFIIFNNTYKSLMQ